MKKYRKNLILALVCFLIVIVLNFFLPRLLPGDVYKRQGVGDRRTPRRLRLGGGEFGEGHHHCGGVANATINEALKSFYSLFRCFSCRPAAFLSVWGGQPVLEVGVVGADEDGGVFLVKIDFGVFSCWVSPLLIGLSYLRLRHAIGTQFPICLEGIEYFLTCDHTELSLI